MNRLCHQFRCPPHTSKTTRVNQNRSTTPEQAIQHGVHWKPVWLHSKEPNTVTGLSLQNIRFHYTYVLLYIHTLHLKWMKFNKSKQPFFSCKIGFMLDLIRSCYNNVWAQVYSSGLATASVIADLLRPDDHIICCDDVYGGTQRFFRTVKANHGIKTDMVNLQCLDNIKKAITPSTKVGTA